MVGSATGIRYNARRRDLRARDSVRRCLRFVQSVSRLRKGAERRVRRPGEPGQESIQKLAEAPLSRFGRRHGAQMRGHVRFGSAANPLNNEINGSADIAEADCAMPTLTDAFCGAGPSLAVVKTASSTRPASDTMIRNAIT